MSQEVRVGVLWRGDRRTGQGSERADAMLGPLFEAFAELNIPTERVIYADDAIEEVRDQLLRLDGVLVWVNPIQDGANRRQLDQLLSDVSAKGVWVSAHPDVIARMGTKEVLFSTRSLGWGTDTDLYRTRRDLQERMPSRLARDGRIVIKQARGTAGNGVWRVDLAEAAHTADRTPTMSANVRVLHAASRDSVAEEVPLADFIDRLAEYFAWSGSLIVQPYQPRLAEGMIRCYFVQDQVVGFCHQWPTGLLDKFEGGPRQRGPMEDPDASAYQTLRLKAESEWVPAMEDLLGLGTHELPVIWDADFLYGPKDNNGPDSYVLCEINISAVWPYPTQASRRMANATISAIQHSRRAKR
jgi:hypothetical protein